MQINASLHQTGPRTSPTRVYDSSAPCFGCREIVAVISVQRLFGAGQNDASENGTDKFGASQNGADINWAFKYHNARELSTFPNSFVNYSSRFYGKHSLLQ